MKVIIKNGVLKKIKGGKDLTNFEIPEGVTSIDPKAFKKCPNLKKIVFPGSIKIVTDQIVSAIKVGGSKIKEITLKEGVEEIAQSAFSRDYYLEKISCPNTLVKIENKAFYSCDNLKEALIPDSVKVIGDHAFYSCSSMKKLQIGNCVEKIGENAFCHCGIDQVNIPSSVKVIGNNAFSSCESLKKVYAEGELKYLGSGTFTNCKVLEEVTLPSFPKPKLEIFNGANNIKKMKTAPNDWNIYMAINSKFDSVYLLKDGSVLTTKDEETFEKSGEKENVVMSCKLKDIVGVFAPIIDVFCTFTSEKNNLAKLLANTKIFRSSGIKFLASDYGTYDMFEEVQQKNFSRLTTLYEHVKKNISEEMEDKELSELFKIAYKLGMFEDDDVRISIEEKEYPVADVALKVLKKAFDPIEDEKLGKIKPKYWRIVDDIRLEIDESYDFDLSVLTDVVEKKHFETMRRIQAAAMKRDSQTKQQPLKTTPRR